MYRRQTIITCIIILLLSAAACLYTLDRRTEIPSFNALGKYITEEGRIVYSDGRSAGARIFSLDERGKVQKLFAAEEGGGAAAFAKGEDGLYVLFSDGVKNEGTAVCRRYRIRLFSRDLVPLATSGSWILHPDERAVSLDRQGGTLYITALSMDGRTAEVYPLEIEGLFPEPEEALEGGKAGAENSEGETEEAEAAPLDSIILRESGAGRFFADAAFSGGELLTRSDAEAPEGIFAPDPAVVSAVEEIHFSLPQKLRLAGQFPAYWVLGTFLFLAFLVLLIFTFWNRRRMIFTALILEVVFAAMLTAFFSAYLSAETKAISSARFDYAERALYDAAEQAGGLNAAMEDYDPGTWYDSASYRELQGTLAALPRSGGSSGVFYDALLLSLKDGKILASVSGRNREEAALVYGEALRDLMERLSAGERTAEGTLTVAGQDYGLTGITERAGHSEYALAGILNEVSPTADVWESRAGLFGKLLLIFSLGSLFLFFILYQQSGDLRKLEEALSNVALGRTQEKKEIAPGRDMASMWNSLMEIEKRIDRINYSRYRIYESYYRFAPKNIEKILGRDSIAEVEAGDVASLSGTLCLAAGGDNSRAENRIDYLNGLLAFLRDHEEEEGILVSNNGDLSVAELLFLEDSHEVQSFGIDLVRDNLGKRRISPPLTVLLYYGSFQYGVAGTEEQSLSFLLCPGAEELPDIASWLRTLKLGLVITEEVRAREKTSSDLRYIGEIGLMRGARTLKLYEVLDACPERERQAKMADRERFREGLRLFRQNDYYMARSCFSEILKRFPEDEVARWYLFESEQLLDSRAQSENPGMLHF